MPDIESLIQGSRKLTDIFGRWPSFHDAEIIELHFWRGEFDSEKKQQVFPVLTVKLHVWELTNETDELGYLVLRHHTLTTLRFHSLDEFGMEGFNHQNAIFELVIDLRDRTDGSPPFFFVEFKPAFGMCASFKCFQVEVVDAARCTKDGEMFA